MSNPNGQNPYPGHGQQPPYQGYGGYGQMPPGQPAPYPGAPGPGMLPQPPPGGARSPVASGLGSSRLIPILAGCGLAVGVFTGLLVVRGIGSADENDEMMVAVADAGVPDARPAPPDAAPPPKPRDVTITFEVSPRRATIKVDGTEVSDGTYMAKVIKGDSKTVEIEISASGYKTVTESRDIEGDDTFTFELEKKRSGSRSSGSSRRSGRSSRDLIDL
jgi:hypothetical protein